MITTNSHVATKTSAAIFTRSRARSMISLGRDGPVERNPPAVFVPEDDLTMPGSGVTG
jgi:hypothetical protein